MWETDKRNGWYHNVNRRGTRRARKSLTTTREQYRIWNAQGYRKCTLLYGLSTSNKKLIPSFTQRGSLFRTTTVRTFAFLSATWRNVQRFGQQVSETVFNDEVFSFLTFVFLSGIYGDQKFDIYYNCYKSISEFGLQLIRGILILLIN